MISLKDLSDDQKASIREWAAKGAGLDEMHTRMRDEMGLRLTFMDARFLVADLEIEFDEEEEEVVEEPPAAAEPAPAATPATAEAPAVPVHDIDDVKDVLPEGDETIPPMPQVTVEISDIAAPGAMARWYRRFWHTDKPQSGPWMKWVRLGLNPTNEGFEPSELEAMAFQQELQRVAQTRGF